MKDFGLAAASCSYKSIFFTDFDRLIIDGTLKDFVTLGDIGYLMPVNLFAIGVAVAFCWNVVFVENLYTVDGFFRTDFLAREED